MNDILNDIVSIFGIRNESVSDKNFWDFLKKYGSFETSKSKSKSMLLQEVTEEISGDQHASERWKAVF
jgi:hypothetical protein